METYKDDLLKDLSEIPEITEALLLLEESSYSITELATYDKYWDSIRSEKTLIIDAENKGIEKGIEKVATAAKNMGMSTKDISKLTGLSEDEIDKL
jgi:hypothetical protein